MPQGHGARCWGFVSDQGDYAVCTREERAGRIPHNGKSGGFHHKLAGQCLCGEEHGPAPARVQPIGSAARTIAATYAYTDEQGALLFEVCRMHPKDFRQRRPDGKGGWIWKLEDLRVVPYRLPELITAVAAGDTVYIAEGEKDVDAIRDAGFPATCNPMGAGKWREEFSRYFAGASVVIVRDKDQPGTEHARQVFKSLKEVAAEIRVVEARVGKDAADHLAAGHTLAELVPVWPVANLRLSDPVAWKRQVLRMSFDATDPIREVDPEKALARPSEPTWPTGLEGEGNGALPNMRGVVIMAGPPSSAKSYLALASGVCAARAGWDALYMVAEMAEIPTAKRLKAYLCGCAKPDTFHHVDVSFGASIEGLLAWIEQRVSDRPTLVIIDSLTSFCDQASHQNEDDPHGLGLSKRLVMWAINARRATDGQIAFVLIMESNKEGRARGRTADHKADLALGLESDPKRKSVKKIIVSKAWEYETGVLGFYGLDWRTARLTRLDE